MANEGYRKLIVWQNLYALRRMVYEITKRFPKSEMRRVSQMNDAARSSKQNVQEGYGRSLAEYIRYLVISKGSLNELSGDLEDCFDDKLITAPEYDKLKELCGKTNYLEMRLIQSLRNKQKL